VFFRTPTVELSNHIHALKFATGQGMNPTETQNLDASQPTPGTMGKSPDVAAPPIGLFLLLAIEVACFVALLGVYVVLRESYPQVFDKSASPIRPGWGLMQLVIVMLAAGSVVFAARCVRMRWKTPAMCFLAAAMMYGLVFLATLTLDRVGRTDVWAEVHAAVQASHAQAAPAPAGPAAMVTPAAEPELPQWDTVRGAGAYMSSCAGCHGAQARGVANIAPALRDTPFMGRVSHEGLFAVAVLGRAANDPESQTGRPMPPRGGNPFLSDADAHNIVAYLMELQHGKGGEATAVAVDPATLVPRWVVGPAASGPAGVADHVFDPPVPADNSKMLDSLHLLFAGLQAFHVTVGLVVAAWLLVRVWTQCRSDQLDAVRRLAPVYWLAGAVSWLIAFPLLYMLP